MESSAMPRRLVVMAHYDPDGLVADHVRRQILAWQDVAEKLIVVTTSTLRQDQRAWLREHAQLIERENYGYDFWSYRTGLAAAGDLSGWHEVVLCNDTFVGPLRSYRQIFEEMDARPVDFWGLVSCRRRSPHVQSFFLVFRSWLVASDTFQRFWRDLEPLSDRWTVIQRYEAGLSTLLLDAGFRMGAYYRETAADARLARRRVLWWAMLRPLFGEASAWTQRREYAAEYWNPASCLADIALDGGRLPVVKIDTLRHDPYRLDAGRLLHRCEQVFGAEFAGVADYLDRTAARYPQRRFERLRATPLPLRPLQSLVRFR